MNMRKELEDFIQSRHILETSREMFKMNFDSYREEEPEEFYEYFGEFRKELFEADMKSVEFILGKYPNWFGVSDSSDWNEEYVAVIIKMVYHEKEIGEYKICFDMDGEVIDDYFVMYYKGYNSI